MRLVCLFFLFSCSRPPVNAPFRVRENRPYPMMVWVGPGFDVDSRTAISKAIAKFPCDIFIQTKFVTRADVIIEPNRGQSHCLGSSAFSFDEGSPGNPFGNAGEYMHCKQGPSTIITTKYLQAEMLDGEGKTRWRYDLDRRMVIFVHELGHAAGLDHAPQTAVDDEFKDIMEPYVLNHKYKRRPDNGPHSPALTRSELLDLTKDYCNEAK